MNQFLPRDSLSATSTSLSERPGFFQPERPTLSSAFPEHSACSLFRTYLILPYSVSDSVNSAPIHSCIEFSSSYYVLDFHPVLETDNKSKQDLDSVPPSLADSLELYALREPRTACGY